MRSVWMRLTVSYLALNPNSCTPQQIDSFCQVYNQVVVNRGDGTITATSGVKRRLLANEKNDREFCKPSA
jgi:hypothetical protein